jgi:uncharacterized membrane protein YecN with MAPEG domain
MKRRPPKRSPRERYRLLVSILVIPLGLIIVVRASLIGLQAWTLILLGLALVGLRVVRLWASRGGTQTKRSTMQKGKGK